MSETRHPDDPRPVREQFMRTYPFITCELYHTNYAAIAGNNARTWRPACWHKPIDRWWGEGELPILPPPVEERWPTFGPGKLGYAPRRPVSPYSNGAAYQPLSTPEEIARLHAESRARAAARGKRERWEEA